jgi:hypothetical protein
MYFVSPRAGEKYYLRLLLCHVRGAKEWKDLLTVKVDGEDKVFDTYKEACIAHGFLEDDREWHRCLGEAAHHARAWQLRHLFAVILEYNQPERPGALWEAFLPAMMDDKVHALHEAGLICDEAALARCANAALWDVEVLLRAQGRHVTDYAGMPVPHEPVGPEVMSDVMRAELAYDREVLQADAARDLEKCTEEQRAVVDKCMALLSQGSSVNKMICIDSPAGGGKTFLLNLLLCMVRGVRGEIALASASTGIAAMLLAGGTTAHSRFGIPVPVVDESVSTITMKSQRAEVIRAATMLIWDEISMADKQAVQCADALCREIMRLQDPLLEKVPFGGKLMVFAGDWRQLLPVVVRGGRAQVFNTCMKRSILWQDVTVMNLTRNMRVEALGEGSEAGQELKAFSKWLLDIGEGRSGAKVKLPEDIVMDFEDEQGFIDDVFPNLSVGGDSLKSAILMPLTQGPTF